MSAVQQAAAILATAKRVCVLSGAGVSAESGVPTFRASDGLWEGHKIEDVATPMGFEANPALVWQFYNARRVNVSKVKPNPGHHALMVMEAKLGDGFTIATQNVDGLHQMAGSANVLELHGCLRETRCMKCKAIENRGLTDLGDKPLCPSCGGRLRPNIVWFHESLPTETWRKAEDAAEECEAFMVVGTSAVVYPAAGLVHTAKRAGAKVLEFNLTKTDASSYADIGVYGPSGETLSAVRAALGW
ncbi:MAG: SIR2 family NAD-dependent protein deacylase [Fimbriiglobus sp.]